MQSFARFATKNNYDKRLGLLNAQIKYVILRDI